MVLIMPKYYYKKVETKPTTPCLTIEAYKSNKIENEQFCPGLGFARGFSVDINILFKLYESERFTSIVLFVQNIISLTKSTKFNEYKKLTHILFG